MTREHSATTSAGPARSSARPSLGWRRLLRTLERLQAGQLTVTLPGGDRHLFRGTQPGPSATLHLHSVRVLLRLLGAGSDGMTASHLAGEWSSPDLAALLELGARNEHALGAVANTAGLAGLWQRLRHRLRANTRRGSRRNIAYHYDLGNDFYRSWLDETMSYSCALFSTADQPLADAQRAKYRRMLALIEPAPGAHILEIGCGWGGFAEHAARQGYRVTGITLSSAQLAYARARLQAAGLSERVDLQLLDYRDLQGRFDHAVSIEMFEAVGERYWDTFFATLARCLRPGGRAALQAITIADAYFERYRRGVDFIQTHIFPGGMLPSPTAFATHARRAGFAVTGTAFRGADYARTLALWQQRFHALCGQLDPAAYPPRFQRAWNYYLAYCQAGFRCGRIDLMDTRLET